MIIALNIPKNLCDPLTACARQLYLTFGTSTTEWSPSLLVSDCFFLLYLGYKHNLWAIPESVVILIGFIQVPWVDKLDSLPCRVMC